MTEKYCCDRFLEDSTGIKPGVGRGFLYPKESHPDAQFELDEDGKSWNIKGCCGGGCYVVTGMLFCPYCGMRLIEEEQ